MMRCIACSSNCIEETDSSEELPKVCPFIACMLTKWIKDK